MGVDDIPADLFLLALPHMLPAVTHVFNLSLTQAEFPTQWKVSKICPLFKGGDQASREEPKQYRPVALLPAVARLLEKIICEQVMEYMYEEDLIHSQNHGYRKGHGTISAVLEAQESVLEAMDTGNVVGIVTLDQSAAFDIIEHNILYSKMKLYGFSESSLKWFQNYLKERSQFVSLESSRSDVMPIGPFACLQGSCLGPLIWNLYCGEAAEVLPLKNKVATDEVVKVGKKTEVRNRWKVGNLYQYADDLMILIVGKDIESVKIKASEAYTTMQDWFLRNRLKLNSQKTHFMYVMTRQRATGKNWQEPVDFNGDQIVPSKSEKILGITLGTNMSVGSHLLTGDCSVLSQVSTKMRALWLIKKHLSFKSRKITAWGLVMSRMLYGIEVWGTTATETQIKQMQVVHNSVMRWICAADRGTRTLDLLRMTGMMSIRQMIMYRVLMTGLTAMWNGAPKGMSQWRSEKTRKLQITMKSFRFIFGRMTARLPADMFTKDPRKNKADIKRWILATIPWDEKWEGLGDNADDTENENEDE